MKELDVYSKWTIAGGVFFGLVTYDVFKGVVSYLLVGVV